MTNPTPLKVLCITGWCRNGSTIIGNILNEVPGFCHVGELAFLWKNAAGRGVNQECGCGRKLFDCPVWSTVLPIGQPADTPFTEHADTVIRRQQGSVRTRHTWQVLGRGLRSAPLRAHAALMTEVYHAVAERTNSRVIVDTSKIPGEAALLPYLDDIIPYYVHLVRDPRAVAQSWSKPKDYVYAMSPGKSTGYWTGFNVATHAITRRYPQRSLFLRYEDFIAAPEPTIGALLAHCDSDPAANPVTDRTVELRTNHTVTGNPDRFHTGTTVIRGSDDSWRTGLPKSAQRTVAALSWPLARRYGYALAATKPEG
ncbi:sulfotransferase family protein [Nocardia brasiliensis]|uniref:Sulfotransferase family protein n=1 Tax=Nocardia brasiliensis TaxID=37326 RepID=A0A6G9XSJ0_NOCBR|nr:sulfotransferase [Nocardia brasiliensis]QIS03793.1 sulfotransferase family protein [Nocardia brasiliensis]